MPVESVTALAFSLTLTGVLGIFGADFMIFAARPTSADVGIA